MIDKSAGIEHFSPGTVEELKQEPPLSPLFPVQQLTFLPGNLFVGYFLEPKAGFDPGLPGTHLGSLPYQISPEAVNVKNSPLIHIFGDAKEPAGPRPSLMMVVPSSVLIPQDGRDTP